jgi:hypothetical protein
MTYCQEVVEHIQAVIDWMNAVVQWLNSLWWLFGAQNGAINEINSYINTLQGWQRWVEANCALVTEIAEIVTAIEVIVGFICKIIEIFG